VLLRIGAIFVDAGYLFSAGSDLLFGRVHRRKDLLLTEPSVLLDHITRIASDCCDDEDLRILRTYWYDGAVNGLPAAEQVAVGDLPRVKLRLGRLNAGGQKGVDGLIILDLVTLATNRAVDTVILLSGDEDLREAALHAQSFGVSVVLIGVPPTKRQRQSELLVRESDHHILLDRSVLAAHLELASPLAVSSTNPAGAGASSAVDSPATLSVPEDETAATLARLAKDLVSDSRFSELADVVSPTDPSRLTRRADRMLVARLADLTGRFPVEKQLLERARRACVDAAVTMRSATAETARPTPRPRGR
jgi:hypothetical protein